MLESVLQQVSQPPAIHLGEIAVDYSGYLLKYLPNRLHLIADKNTLAAASASNLPFPILCFEDSPKATLANVERIRKATASADGLVAVGSGTLNDLTKYAAFLDKKPYGVIATAPSMNGYVSANVSLSDASGFKHSFAAQSPLAVLADSQVLRHAPLPLIQAGIGDILCRSTVQTDWLFSHLLMGTPYDAKYFEWLRPLEMQMISSLRGGIADAAIQSGSFRYAHDDEFTEILFEALILSGLAMRDAGSSMPASQGEHLIAHAREMLFPQLPAHFHGLEIAVTTLSMSALQEKILQQHTPPRIHYESPRSFIPTHLLEAAETQYFSKLPFKAYVDILNASLEQHWDFFRAQLINIALPADTLSNVLQKAGCPTTPTQLGWDDTSYRKALHSANFLRNRLTFLDLYHL